MFQTRHSLFFMRKAYQELRKCHEVVFTEFRFKGERVAMLRGLQARCNFESTGSVRTASSFFTGLLKGVLEEEMLSPSFCYYHSRSRQLLLHTAVNINLQRAHVPSNVATIARRHNSAPKVYRLIESFSESVNLLWNRIIFKFPDNFDKSLEEFLFFFLTNFNFSNKNITSNFQEINSYTPVFPNCNRLRKIFSYRTDIPQLNRKNRKSSSLSLLKKIEKSYSTKVYCVFLICDCFDTSTDV